MTPPSEKLSNIERGGVIICIAPCWIVPYIDPDNVLSYKYSRFRPDRDGLVDYETGEFFESFEVGCGKCLECLQVHKLQWVHRLLDEASLHEQSMFLTLTYAEGSSQEISLVKEDLQKFIKRLRKKIYPLRCRYYACGEYGSLGKRPHYHVIIFGYWFPDAIKWKRDKKGFYMYRSQTLEKLWTYGFSSICPVCDKTLEYVTKDMQKLLPKNDDRLKPFTIMSTKPGIGYDAIPDKVPIDGKIWHNGKSVNIPRYYKKVLKDRGLERDVYKLNEKMALYSDNRKKHEDVNARLKNYFEKKKKLLDKGKILC